MLPGSRKGDGCSGCRDGAELRCRCSKLVVLHYPHHHWGPRFLGGKSGYPMGSVSCLPSRLQWEGVWVSSCVFLFPVVSTFLWVKHLLPLNTFGITIAIIRHILSHCFLCSVKCYVYPWSLLFSLLYQKRWWGEGK